PKGAPRPQRMKWNLRLAWLALHGDYPGDLLDGYRLQVADLGEESPVGFRDVAAALGVAKRDRGRGTAWGDFDGDGDLDLFSTGIQVPHSLYRNESGERFTDVTAAAGLGDPRGGWSATAVDYDNDGDLDLYATRDAWEGKAPNSLYRNLGDLRFVEISEEAGVDDPDDSFTAAWADVDNDGRVDLYVAEGITGGGTPNKLFLNRGDRFEDGADRFGVAHPGKSLGVAFGDYDRDGDIDLYVADVAGPNTLYRNDSGSGFTDVTDTAGVAGPVEGGYVAFFADFDRDGAIDLFVSSMCYYEQFVESQVAGRAVGRNRAHLYRNLGGDRFADVAPDAGISRNFGTMGAGIGDVDYDGLVDLYLANGGPVMPRFEPNILYHNRGDRFADVTESAGVGNLGKGHGATFADFDGDGDLDLYAAIGGHYPGDLWPNSLYRNDGRGAHWLAVELEGRQSNRSAVGAQVTVHAGGRKLIEEVASGGGFGTTNSLPLEFGLGAVEEVSRVEVRWPSGQATRIDNPEVDGTVRIREGEAR
ncbi:MAG: CRTAC1 family protein, partial [Gemmatimonadetes bacterium]|nr:CRTAC1 family protein [Gemmatimonadota bacterium]